MLSMLIRISNIIMSSVQNAHEHIVFVLKYQYFHRDRKGYS